jgi:hypothetical protein
MAKYSDLLEKLSIASVDENNLHCIKVLDQLTILFETMELKKIPKAKFQTMTKRLVELLSKETLYVKQLSVLKTDITEILRKEHGLTTRLYYRLKWVFNGGILIGMPLGLLSGSIFGYESVFNWVTPIGVIMGYLIGFLIGRTKDKKAFKKGTQLNVI